MQTNRPLALTSYLIYIPLVCRHLEDHFAIVYNRFLANFDTYTELCREKNRQKRMPGYLYLATMSRFPINYQRKNMGLN